MYFESSKEFNERLKDLLSEKNVKAADLARYLEVSRSTISLWLSGKRFPNEEMKNLICRYLNISYLELLYTREEIALGRIREFFGRYNLQPSDYERFDELMDELSNRFIDIVHKYRKAK